jgi:hypothetical protein
VFFC